MALIESAIAIAIAMAKIFTAVQVQDLPQALARMADQIPSEEAPASAWRDWADQLEALWLDTLGLTAEAITFTRAEAEALRDYLYTTQLLLRCKEAAVRIPKQGWAELKARLLTV